MRTYFKSCRHFWAQLLWFTFLGAVLPKMLKVATGQTTHKAYVLEIFGTPLMADLGIAALGGAATLLLFSFLFYISYSIGER